MRPASRCTAALSLGHDRIGVAGVKALAAAPFETQLPAPILCFTGALRWAFFLRDVEVLIDICKNLQEVK